jgi:hypothetical protein
LIGKILYDCRAFGQHASVIQLQCGYGALGIDGREVRPLLGLLGLKIDLFHGEGQTRFEQDDMGR